MKNITNKTSERVKKIKGQGLVIWIKTDISKGKKIYVPLQDQVKTIKKRRII